MNISVRTKTITLKKILWALNAPQSGNILTIGVSAAIGIISTFIPLIKKDIVKKNNNTDNNTI